MAYRLSAPSKSGYEGVFDTLAEVREAAAAKLGDWTEPVSVDDMIEVTGGGDGRTIYCYATQADADADDDGAYAVQYVEE